LYNGTYKKNYKLNQTSIAGANGSSMLSIPLIGGRQQKLAIADVCVQQGSNWQRQHLAAIQSAYGRAPYFDELWPQINAVYQQHSGGNLLQFNLAILQLISKILRHQCEIGTTFDHTEFIACSPTNIIYQQVFTDKLGFLPNLCILDLLMNEGPRARQLLV
jgi:hypothetical protein